MGIRKLAGWGLLLLVGAAVVSPAIAYLGLDPLPGDFSIDVGNFHLAVPLLYSLAASVALALLYSVLKR